MPGFFVWQQLSGLPDTGALAGNQSAAHQAHTGYCQQEQPDRVHAGRLGVADGTAATAAEIVCAAGIATHGDRIFNHAVFGSLVGQTIAVRDRDFDGTLVDLVPEALGQLGVLALVVDLVDNQVVRQV